MNSKKFVFDEMMFTVYSFLFILAGFVKIKYLQNMYTCLSRDSLFLFKNSLLDEICLFQRLRMEAFLLPHLEVKLNTAYYNEAKGLRSSCIETSTHIQSSFIILANKIVIRKYMFD